MMKRMLSLLLCMVMMLSMVPVQAIAQENTEEPTELISEIEAVELATEPKEPETVLSEVETFVAEETTVPTEATLAAEVAEETEVTQATEEAEETEATVPFDDEDIIPEPSENFNDTDAEMELVCTCESDDPDDHAPFCNLYVRQIDPECYCTEKCTADAVNEWCDLCYFGIEGCCAEEETAAVYALTQDMDGYYIIATADDLYAFAEMVNGGANAVDGKLTADIVVNTNVLTESGALNPGEYREWLPIGSESNPYNGTFDGRNHTISGLYYNYNDATNVVEDVGLFGSAGAEGKIQNLGVVDGYFNVTLGVGAIAGRNYGIIENCYNTNYIIAGNRAGGIVGSNTDAGKISKCYNKGIIRADEWCAGGIAGGGGYIEYCYNTGPVYAYVQRAGGISGARANVKSCYNVGRVSSPMYAGGIVGIGNIEDLNDCYYHSEDCGVTRLVGSVGSSLQNNNGSGRDTHFANGMITYKLNGDQSNLVWFQTCGEGMPAFSGEIVYSYINGGCSGNARKHTSYTNDPNKEDNIVHTWETVDSATIRTCSACKITECEALGHTEVIDAAVVPTCMEKGLTEGKHCSVCGEILLAQEEIPAGHNIESGLCIRCGVTGTCGENLIWVFDAATHTLTISGEGAMYDYPGAGGPWKAQKNAIYKVVIEEGVTNVGTSAFLNHSVSSVSLPEGFLSIGSCAFDSCGALMTLQLSDSLEEIGYSAFYESSVNTLTIPANLKTIGTNAFLGSNLREITFLGDAPVISGKVFYGLKLTAYYPAGNVTWTESVRSSFGGTTTWVSVCYEHTAVIDEAVAPTCTETGLTEGKHCSACGAILVAQEEIPATGHNYEATYTDATFDSDGFTTYTCACGDSYTESDPGTMKDAAASIGNVKYGTLSEAFAEAKQGDTINLLMSYTISGGTTETWDLTGKTLEIARKNVGIIVEGKLTVLGGTYRFTEGSNHLVIQNNGHVTIEDGTFHVACEYGIWVHDGQLIINGGTFYVTENGDITTWPRYMGFNRTARITFNDGVFYFRDNGQFSDYGMSTINGGTFYLENPNDASIIAGCNDYRDSLNISGGTFYISGAVGFNANFYSQFYIRGGTFIATNDTAEILYDEGASLGIYGGTFSQDMTAYLSGDYCCTKSDDYYVVGKHLYNIEKVDDACLKTEASCMNAAEYYLSCACGKIGTGTFTYGDALGHSYDNGICTNCGTGTAGKIVIQMHDSQNDGWGGCKIIVRKYHPEGSWVTYPSLDNGNAGTCTLDFDSTAGYEFAWHAGIYSNPSECSFTIYVDGETKLEVSDGSSIESGTILTIGDLAEITGVTITVDGVTYTQGDVIITPETKSIIYTVTGNHLEKIGDYNGLAYASSKVLGRCTENGRFFSDGNLDRSSYISHFNNCDRFEVQYSNDRMSSWNGTGIYLTYVEPTTLAITKQPESVQQEIGKKFSITVEAEGDGLTYQWYYKNNGGKEFAPSSFKSNSYDMTMASYCHNRQVYCVITDQYGNSVTTNTVTITRPPVELTIIEQPQDVQATVGEKFSISVKAEGDGLTYQWYYKNNGGKAFAPSSFRSNAYSMTMASYCHNRQVYCVITDQYGNSITTDTVTITRPPVELTIIEQPQDVQVAIGEKFSVTVKAEGDGLTYQWYYKNDGGKSFAPSSYKSNAYAMTMASYCHNRQIYCVITDQYGNEETTNTVTLTRPPVELKIVEQPKGVQQEIGQKFSIKPTVQGDGLTYQWYYKDAGMKTFKISSNQSFAYAYTMAAYMDNRQVYCVITDRNGDQVTTDVVTIHVG